MFDRSSILKHLVLGCVALAAFSSCASTGDSSPEGQSAAPAAAAPAQAGSPEADDAAVPAGDKVATFAGGCFWCMEPPFEKLPGVISVTSGYTDGRTKNPTYEEVSSGQTGHAESIRIVFDPKKIGYEKLLETFWHNVDPKSPDGQFCDRGFQYRPAIYYHDEAQKRAAEASKRRLETTPQRFEPPVEVRIVAASPFYIAEDYHQDFYKKDKVRYTTYRSGCGRDKRLAELWGKPAAQAEAH